MDKIRNFCIIAHIDHGKSTLADRLLETTKTINITEGQMLDNMDLEKERGITIKSHAIQMEYMYEGEKYTLNLIDTPGHVDFSYEVSRSIAACEGALLVVDATQGVQAQTISNLYMAVDQGLEIIPVINKCDMINAMPEEVKDEIVDLIGCDRNEIIEASGKTGMGVEEILRAVVERIPAPVGDEEAPLQALIFDSVFNSFRGIIAYFKITNGVLRKGAVSAQNGETLIIPINMRDGSLICRGKGNPEWNCTAPHGAGRMMTRSQAKQEIALSDYQQAMQGIYTTCVSESTLDESPFVYRGIDEILDVIDPTAEVVHLLTPVYNFKASKAVVDEETMDGRD